MFCRVELDGLIKFNSEMCRRCYQYIFLRHCILDTVNSWLTLIVNNGKRCIHFRIFIGSTQIELIIPILNGELFALINLIFINQNFVSTIYFFRFFKQVD